MTITLDETNKFQEDEGLPFSISSISWDSTIPEGATIRFEYKNGAFIDIKNDNGTIKVSYSKKVSGNLDDVGTFENPVLLNEGLLIYSKEEI
jgi:hypothetical protein